MGVAESNITTSPFLQQLTFIETTNDKHFGPIDIYRTKEAPFDYLMNVKKHFVQDHENLSKYQRVINQIKSLQHKNLAKIHHWQFTEENHLCIKHRFVQVFSNYYNFTLQKAIEMKKLQDSSFPENQLLYIMGCLLDLAIFLQNYGLTLGEYRSQSIFLSPEGYIKLYLLQPDEQNKHHCYYKVLCQKNLTEQYIFSPQQLQSLNTLEYEINYDIFKADVFAIGMVMLQLITLDRPKFYYNADKTALKMDRISFDLSSMNTRYSDDFINLLRACLNPKPSDRSTLYEVDQQLNRFRKMSKSVTHCVRLHEEQSKTKRNGRRQNGMSAKGEHLLRGLQKKLTPSPITTMHSSTNNSISNSVKASNLGIVNIKTQYIIQI